MARVNASPRGMEQYLNVTPIHKTAARLAADGESMAMIPRDISSARHPSLRGGMKNGAAYGRSWAVQTAAEEERGTAMIARTA